MSVETEPVSFMMFMAHIPCIDISYVEQQLLLSCQGKYLIAPEQEPYDHLHFLCEMSNQSYHSFSKRVFKDKYNLRGRAVKDKARQYGKVKALRSIEQALIYTLKCYNTSKSMIRTNMDKNELEKYAQASFKKKEELKAHDVYIERLRTLPPPDGKDVSHLVHLWMDLCPTTRPPLIKSLLWYAYQAKYITQEQFIMNYYKDTQYQMPIFSFPELTYVQEENSIMNYACVDSELETDEEN